MSTRIRSFAIEAGKCLAGTTSTFRPLSKKDGQRNSPLNVIHVRIESIGEMEALGKLFGSYFVRPLIESDDCTANNPVVALYGSKGVGKTTFATQSCHSFPAAYNYADRSLPEDRCFGAYFFASRSSGDDCLFRWKDFGHYINALPPIAPEFRKRDSFVPRNEFQDSQISSIPGLDILEHALEPYLKGAHIVVIVGGHAKWSRDYYWAQSEGMFHPKGIRQSGNLQAKEIGKQMRKMLRASTKSPAPLGDDPRLAFSPLGGVDAPISAQTRYATLLLTTDNATTRKAFRTFRQKLAEYTSALVPV